MVDALLGEGASVVAIDKLFIKSFKYDDLSRRLKRLGLIYAKHAVPTDINNTFVQIDLETQKDKLQNLLRNVDVVFHLAALFGGRQYVDEHQSECARMLAVDQNVIDATFNAGVPFFHYASSACVYPPGFQSSSESQALKETDVGMDSVRGEEWWKGSDNLYGWAKLMGELQCKVYHDEKGLSTSTCRYLTVYGPGEFDSSHAIPALIERALGRANPFEIWGSGRQERGFTYVDDIVAGSITAVERIRNGTPINLGTNVRYSVDEVAARIVQLVGYKPEIVHDARKPEGPFSRGLDITRAKILLDWEPKMIFGEGLKRTVAWHRGLQIEQSA